MGTDPFFLDRRSRSQSYVSYPIRIPIQITLLFIYLINTILFHNSKQYICSYNTYVGKYKLLIIVNNIYY